MLAVEEQDQHVADGDELRRAAQCAPEEVALARALANGPEVLLLDEPTAALDPESGAQVVALLRGLCARGLAVVMVTHVEAHAEALGGARYRCEGGKVTALP